MGGRDGVMLVRVWENGNRTSSSGVAGGNGLAEGREAREQAPWYTVVGVIDDGSQLNQAVTAVRELGVDRDDLTVVFRWNCRIFDRGWRPARSRRSDRPRIN